MTCVGVLDHLVMGAASLQQAAAWCERELGVTPLAGGRHALMGTHNCLLALASPEAPRAYLEFIAIDPEALSRELGLPVVCTVGVKADRAGAPRCGGSAWTPANPSPRSAVCCAGRSASGPTASPSSAARCRR